METDNQHQMKQPFKNSYWVVPGQVAAGEYPGSLKAAHADAKMKALLDAGMNHFVDLTEPSELNPYFDLIEAAAESRGLKVSYECHPIVDLSIPKCREDMLAILDAIDAAIAAGKTVYVHCLGGVGRTGTVIGCWLVRHGRSGSDALSQIAEWWKQMEKIHRRQESPETPTQKRYVRDWKEPSKAGNQVSTQDRFRGCLLGLAAGDALGTTLEFKQPGSFDPIDDMIGGGPFGLEPGQWTDDTSMALCLAASLVECNGFDPKDQMQRYVRWWHDGYQSCTGHCFDIGNTVRGALSRFSKSGEPYSGSTEPHSAGNGSLMRLAPVPMFFAENPAEAIRRSADSSRTTHGATEAVDACRYFGGLLIGALKGESKETLLSTRYSPSPDGWEVDPLAEKIDAIAVGSFKHREPPEIQGKGYVVPALEAALWAFNKSATFKDGALLAVNLGNDADTTGAIYGQIAGAYYGVGGIPEVWLERLAWRKEIEHLADRSYEQAIQTTT